MTSEHDLQCAVVDWANWQAIQNPDYNMLYANPNGGKRHKEVARKLKKEGVKRGIPDLFLAVPKQPYHGLFIELKRDAKQRVTQEQQDWIRRLNLKGYYAVVCTSFEDTIHTMELYLQGKIQTKKT